MRSYSNGSACSPFGGIPRNWKLPRGCDVAYVLIGVPPSGGSLEIGNSNLNEKRSGAPSTGSPFGGIPRNWKRAGRRGPPPGVLRQGSPFGGIPRNWKPLERLHAAAPGRHKVPPSGGSLEIGNFLACRLELLPVRHGFPLRGDP